MKKIIGFLGVNGSGKDYNANICSLENLNSKIYDFSDGVRDITFGFLGGKPKDRNSYENFKTLVNTINLGDKVLRMSGRDFLDNVGITMRNFDPSFWAKYNLYKVQTDYIKNEVDTFIFNSIRYIEEIQAIVSWFYSVSTKINSIEFYFCDYRSEKYDDSPKDYQKLALILREEGYKDGDNITERILRF